MITNDIKEQYLDFPQAFKISPSVNHPSMLHTHNKHELVLCIKGQGLQCFKDQTIRLDAGAFFWIPKSVPHIATSINAKSPTICVIDIDEKWFNKDTYADAQSLKAIKAISSFVKSNSYLIRLTKQGTKEITNTIENIIEEYNNKQPCWQMIVKSLTIKVISIIIRHSAIAIQETQVESPSKERINDICNYIKNNLYQNMTVENVAKMTNFSKSHFHVLFKQTTNMTFVQFLNQERIKKTEELLKSTNKPLEDIMRECGFKSKSQFYISLKKYSGKTPKQFKV